MAIQEYPVGHPKHGISPYRPMQTAASRPPDFGSWPLIHPETGDRRCPSPGCGEYVCRECWRCGWIRDDSDLDEVVAELKMRPHPLSMEPFLPPGFVKVIPGKEEH
ncbi:hypothetical protein SEA_SKOG_105 [Gordonia phage Skog]|uniref:Uncharacterized protein n=1 Tax=Gordonia phage Skog TaxID=2704033 RepID=A0A6G6XJL4_9CAUD|nr:hypothetical protein KHQ85_gp105 [Gordonia phage Skog]QIG58257.1 hypothetical protein SEA_SKOG_105 [Gordonia phage Skog]